MIDIENPVEKAVCEKVDAIIGTEFKNFNASVKLALLKDMGVMDEYEVNAIVSKMKKNNELEAQYYDKEFELTHDSSGNIIPLYTIDDKQDKGDN